MVQSCTLQGQDGLSPILNLNHSGDQPRRLLRERLGLTQKELAEILGLSGYIPVNHYESGFRTPNVVIQALMRIFDEWPEKKSRELRDTLLEQTRKIKMSSRKKS